MGVSIGVTKLGGGSWARSFKIGRVCPQIHVLPKTVITANMVVLSQTVGA